ncbi:MAG: GerAB/ArcD/ProY family transporter [Clostridiaceae bacterium]|nr:GerAB/ArcD/ProY family transporter [Clostridiaceae bacterium]
MNKLSTRHFMFFIIATTTIALRSYSSLFIEYGGRDTWLIALASCIFIFLCFWFLLHICNKKDTYDLSTILGEPFKFLFAIGLFLAAIESSSVEASAIHGSFFLDTPVWYCLLFLVAGGTYCLFRKFNALLVLVITTVSIALVGDVIFFILVYKHLDLSFLLPVLSDGLSKNKLLCFLGIVGSLSSIMVTLPYLSHIHKKDGLIKNSTLAIVVSTIIVVYSLVSIIGFFGPTHSANIFYPEYIESQRVQIAGFLEFGELFFIYRSVCTWFIKYILSSYGIILLYKDIIKYKKVYLICYGIITFGVSLILTRNQYFLFDSLKLFLMVELFLFIIIPLISFIIFYFRKNNREQK